MIKGVHLTSTQFWWYLKAKDLGLYVIISCHTFFKIVEKGKMLMLMQQDIPPFLKHQIKWTKGKRIPLKESQIKIVTDNIYCSWWNKWKQIEKLNKAYGFASIRYFI